MSPDDLRWHQWLVIAVIALAVFIVLIYVFGNAPYRGE
jgi:hypothetical protein